MSSGLSWQSGRFQNQRSVVRIQSSVNFYNEHVYCCKEGNKDKEKRNGPFFKKVAQFLKSCLKVDRKAFTRKVTFFKTASNITKNVLATF